MILIKERFLRKKVTIVNTSKLSYDLLVQIPQLVVYSLDLNPSPLERVQGKGYAQSQTQTYPGVEVEPVRYTEVGRDGDDELQGWTETRGKVCQVFLGRWRESLGCKEINYEKRG